MSSSKVPPKPRIRGPRGRSTIRIINAAKAAGCHSVSFPDGTVVTISAAAPPVDVGKAAKDIKPSVQN